MYITYMVWNTGDTDSKGTLRTLKEHSIKWDNMSQSGKFYNRDVYGILRGKKTGEIENGRMSQVLKGTLECTCTKGRPGNVTLGKVEEWQKRRLIRLAKARVRKKGLVTKLNIHLKIKNADPWLRDKRWGGVRGVKGEEAEWWLLQ